MNEDALTPAEPITLPEDDADRKMWFYVLTTVGRLLQPPQDELWNDHASGSNYVDISLHGIPPLWLLRRGGLQSCDIHRTVKVVDDLVHTKTFTIDTPNYPRRIEIQRDRDKMLRVWELWHELGRMLHDHLAEIFTLHTESGHWYIPHKLTLDYSEHGRKIVAAVHYREMKRVEEIADVS